MSRETVELVRAAWPRRMDMVDIVGSGSPDDMASYLDPDVEVAFIASAPGVPELRYLGVEGLADGWREWLEPYESYWLEIEDVISAGEDDVVVPVRVSARTKRDGVLIEHSPAAICTARDGKVVRIRFYLDRDHALEVAGLR
jgi:ketosteroid isomerase-like protein